MFTALFASTAVLITWLAYPMLVFALISGLLSLIAAAYGVRMARMAYRAGSLDVELGPGRIVRRVGDETVVGSIGAVAVYPSHLAVVVDGTKTLDLPLDGPSLTRATEALVDEGIPHHSMSGVVGTLVPAVGGLLLCLVLAVLTRLIVYGVVVGGVAVATWVPWLGGAVAVFGAFTAVSRWFRRRR